jgi:hypothetical protein
MCNNATDVMIIITGKTRGRRLRETQCMSEGCYRPVVARGVCAGCYATARQLVITGKTTWRALENLDMTRPRLIDDEMQRCKNPLQAAFLRKRDRWKYYT